MTAPKRPSRIEDILSMERPSGINEDMRAVVEEAVDVALDCKGDEGVRLAAMFDLLASMEYYGRVTNRGWVYCPEDGGRMFYAYTNVCPGCISHTEFVFVKGNKPESAIIGLVSSEILCMMLETVFSRRGRNVQVRRASEPVDAFIYDRDNGILALCEIKSAPMMTLPLIVRCDRLTETMDGDVSYAGHTMTDNTSLKNSAFDMFFPSAEHFQERKVSLYVDWTKASPFQVALSKLLKEHRDIIEWYFQYWGKAYETYCSKDRLCMLYWLTNGCGAPNPRPARWPTKRNGGVESISDAKTSVGMDRTDDLKKATYQALKLGAEYKCDVENLKVVLVSNIHAARHYDEYVKPVEDVIWTKSAEVSASVANELPPQTPMYNLFDGIVSFTKSKARDAWIEDLFRFSAQGDKGV